uniref:Uncharacterized protein n=3 Tax=Brassica TaxID=3705 RepID=A0A0D2ZRV2_BRAOL
MTLHVVEVARVTPAPDSDSVLNSAHSLTIPLTFFDLPWLMRRMIFPGREDSSRRFGERPGFEKDRDGGGRVQDWVRFHWRRNLNGGEK